MNIKSVRFRLSLWYFISFFISAAIVFSVFYAVTKQTLMSQTDQQITRHGEQIVKLIKSENIGTHTVFPQEQLSREFTDMPGMLIIIADANATILSTSQTLGSSAPVIQDVLEKSANIISPVFVDRAIGSTYMRLGIFPVETGDSTRNLVMIAHPADVIVDSLRTLAVQLTVIFIAAGMLSLIGGLLVSKNALAPVTELSSTLKEVSVSNLSRPIKHAKTGDELEELTTSFNALLSRLAASFERERQFIGDVAHELRTPLSTLKNSIEVTLSKQRSGTEYRHIIGDMLTDVNNLSGTVNDVLDLAWAHSDKPNLHGDTVDLTEMMEELTDVIRTLAPEKNITIITEIQKNAVIPGKRPKLFRAFFNLLENAVKYTPKNGKIAVSLDKPKNAVTVEISNTGAGIPVADLPHVFDRFYRGGKQVSAFGTGLGLAIARSIIKAHAGSVSIASNPKKVTTVTVSFPVLMSS